MLGVRLVAIGSVLGLAWTSTSGDTASEAALIGGSALSARTFETSSIAAAQAEPSQTPLANSKSSVAPPSISRVEITSNGTVVFAGLASPGTRVLVRRGADGLGSAPVDENGAWQLQVAEPLGSGEHEIFTEASGNTARGSATVSGDELRIAIPRSFDGPLVAFERPPEEIARERSAIAIETRRQAERLAEAASRRFSELSHELAEKAKGTAKDSGVGRNTESVGRPGGPAPESSTERSANDRADEHANDRADDRGVDRGDDRAGDAGSALDTASQWLQAWLTKANREYQREIIRRLQIPAPGPFDLADDRPPPLPIPSPARHAPEPEPAGSGATASDRIAEAARLSEEAAARRRRDEEAGAAAKLEAEKAAAARVRREREDEERKAARQLAERLEAENEARRTAERKAEAERKAAVEAEREAARRQAERDAATAAAKAAEDRTRVERAAAEKAAADDAAMAKAKAEAERAAAAAEAARAARVAEEAAERDRQARADAATSQIAPEMAQRPAPPAERTVANDIPLPIRKDAGRAVADRLGSRELPPPQRPSAAPAVTEDRSTRSQYAEGDTDEDDVRQFRKARRHARPRVAGWRSPHASCPTAGRRVHPPATYTVASGDTLWSIAFKHYRRGRYYPLIEDANSEIVADPHMIRPCQRLYLPKFDRTALSVLADGRAP